MMKPRRRPEAGAWQVTMVYMASWSPNHPEKTIAVWKPSISDAWHGHTQTCDVRWCFITCWLRPNGRYHWLVLSQVMLHERHWTKQRAKFATAPFGSTAAREIGSVHVIPRSQKHVSSVHFKKWGCNIITRAFRNRTYPERYQSQMIAIILQTLQHQIHQ